MSNKMRLYKELQRKDAIMYLVNDTIRILTGIALIKCGKHSKRFSYLNSLSENSWKIF